MNNRAGLELISRGWIIDEIDKEDMVNQMLDNLIPCKYCGQYNGFLQFDGTDFICRWCEKHQ